VVEGQATLPDVPILQSESETVDTPYVGILSIIIGAIIVGIIISIRRKRKKKQG
jgi:LPXTG-motif cell wall-anchored protein